MIEKFVKGQFTEDDLEQTIIHYFTHQGYGHVNAQEVFSDDNEGVLREGELSAFLKERYKADGITEKEVARAIDHLKNIHAKPLYAGVRETYKDVTSGWDMPRDDKHAVALHVSYVNFDEPQKNTFVAVISDGVNTRLGSIFAPYKHFYMWSKIDEKDKVATGVSSLKTLITSDWRTIENRVKEYNKQKRPSAPCLTQEQGI